MEGLTEEHLKDLLSEEWLVKVDNIKSIPYLFKFHHSSMDLSSMVLITDTKSVWAETLDGKQFARRWRSLDHNSPAPFDDQGDEDSWRESSLELLSNAHTLGAISDMTFEVVGSNFSDFAFELTNPNSAFKWRWEANSVGYKQAAEILSKQLILPLISLNHISQSSPDALSGMADSDVEQAVDKVGRAGRRAPHNHVKQALSKPRTATMLRRITAMFNFIPNLPPIFSTAEKPDLQPKAVEQPPPIPEQSNARSSVAAKAPAKNTTRRRSPSPSPPKPSTPMAVKPVSSTGKAPEAEVPVDGSETEDETDEEASKPAVKASPSNQSSAKTTRGHDTIMRSPSPLRTAATSNTPPAKRPSPAAAESDSEAAPKPTTSQKKQRVASSDDSDSDAKPSQPIVRRGARQPVKRGGKRF